MRLFILCSPSLDDFQLSVLRPLFDSEQIQVVGACIDTATKPSLPTKLVRELRKGRGVYVFVMAVAAARRSRATQIAADEYFESRGVDVLHVDDLYSEASRSFIRSTEPDCIFRTGFGIIREPILSLAPKGVISFHHGDLRRYRGQPVGFWELYHNESEMKITVQILNERLDSGRIVREITIPVLPSDTWRSLERRAYDRSCSLIYESCVALAHDDFNAETVPDHELGRLYTLPNFRQWLVLQIKVLRRRLSAAVTKRLRPFPGAL